ncbi:CRTAC1 family protein [Palleronia sp. LCG004]|uniref:CRTAC1 family protein n=1 Tax=Palleronia sp. LCG004 TaxID=3079304 RepID=UPI0029421074|nr:CRTAC1 family protein [Palleronia sp. LCG004]WOI57536.1 CRTAC1 family protein [Palleronia sp. LCG004]
MRPLALLLALAATPASADGPVFVDRAGALPVEHVYSGGWAHFVGGGVAILDCNDDALPDLYVAGGEGPARLFVNVSEPGGDIAFEPGEVPDLTGVTGAYPVDLDGDGPLDLMVLRVGSNVVLRGAGACRFSAEDAPDGTGSDAWTTAFSATWEPGQDRPTLAFGNYVDMDDPDGPFGACDTNWLLRPDGEGYAATPLDPGFCPLSILFSDWNRDGTPMLRLSNDRHYYLRGGYEQMWRLDPLEELGPEDGWERLSLWGMGIASGDITGDGRPEVMLTSMGDQVMMRSDGGAWSALPYEIGTYAQRPYQGDDGRPSTGWHAEFGDIDNDGRLDLFIAKGNVDQMPGLAMADPNNLLMQQRDGTFVERGGSAGIATTDRSRGGGLADLNGDGLLDIVVVNRRAPLEIWRNATEATGHWIGVSLRQPGGNSRAIGAHVEVRTPDGLQTREIVVGGGHAGGSALPAHFGLGSRDRADLRVIWPDGEATPWQDVAADRVLTIARP